MNSIDSIQVHFNKDGLALLNVCLAYMMFSIAIELKKEDFLYLLKKPKAVLTGMLSQYILFPSVTLLLIKLIHPHPSVGLGMMMVASCPSGHISNYITHLAKGNTALAVSLTAISTVLCPIATPVIFSILGHADAATAQVLREVHIPFPEMLQILLVLLFAPLVLGTLLSYYFPAFINRIKKFIKTTALIIFFAFIIGALSKNIDVFLKFIYMIAAIVFVQDLFGFLLGYVAGRVFRLEEKDCRSISIETGIHNSGLGLILVFSFFHGLGGMALIVAWWGIWHLIAGMSLATWWKRAQP